MRTPAKTVGLCRDAFGVCQDALEDALNDIATEIVNHCIPERVGREVTPRDVNKAVNEVFEEIFKQWGPRMTDLQEELRQRAFGLAFPTA